MIPQEDKIYGQYHNSLQLLVAGLTLPVILDQINTDPGAVLVHLAKDYYHSVKANGCKSM